MTILSPSSLSYFSFFLLFTTVKMTLLSSEVSSSECRPCFLSPFVPSVTPTVNIFTFLCQLDNSTDKQISCSTSHVKKITHFLKLLFTPISTIIYSYYHCQLFSICLLLLPLYSHTSCQGFNRYFWSLLL